MFNCFLISRYLLLIAQVHGELVCPASCALIDHNVHFCSFAEESKKGNANTKIK